MGYFDDHLKTTENHQTYGEHFKVAFYGSMKLLGASLAGLIHAFWPHAYPFYTSSRVIELFQILVKTKRHKDEIYNIMNDQIYWKFEGETTLPPGIYIKVSEDPHDPEFREN